MTYEKALAEFNNLPHGNGDDLDGTVDQLVDRAQRELDFEDGGENAAIGYYVSVAEYKQIAKFIKKWQGK